MLLQDKVIFLTGGSTGIGLDCAKAYAAEGAKVVLVARNGELSAQAAADLGADHIGFACDVSSDSDVKKAIERTLSHFGKIDAIHNNAGIATPSKPLHETTDDEWDALFNINLKSVLHTTRHGIAALRESKGCILNTSSLVGVIGQEIHAAYTATKGGMNTLTKSMALDYAKEGIRVNAVAPAVVRTRFAVPLYEGKEASVSGRYPLGRIGDPEDVAEAVVYLTSDEASWITGQTLVLDGGLTLGGGV